MPKFDAGAVVEPLDYDFTTIRGYPHRKARGTIVEPSDEKISVFIGRLRDMMQEARSMVGGAETPEVDFTDPTAFLKQLDDYDPEKFLNTYTGVANAYSELCSGQPSTEEITALPMRVRLRFFAWLMQEVVSPEAGTGAGMAVVTPLRPAVAG